MSKYKPYDVKENRLNLKFKDKDPARANKTKNSRSIRINKEMMASSRKKQTSNGTVEEEAVILSASYIAKLYTYIDDVKSLVYKPLHKQRCKKDIMQKYNLLKTPNHEIICKKHAFRRMKEEMSLQHYLIRCDSNSRTISINGCQLNAYLKAYLYSMVYPPIFEVCDKDYRDVIFSKYPSLLYMWCNMLEDAIVLDAFMLALHNCMKKLLDHGNNIIGYQNE